MVGTVLVYFLVCLGLTIQFGYAGMVNFAAAAFLGVGCYTAAVLTAHTTLPHLVVLAIGGAVAALIGSILILPVLRTRGHYSAVVTIAFVLLFKTFLEVNDTLGGPQGLKLPSMQVLGWKFNENFSVAGIEFSFYVSYVLVALALAVVAFAVTRRLERSWIGLNLDAVRLDETAAACFGVHVARWKIVAFTLGNFMAGVAGALYALMLGFIAPTNFTFGDSLIMVSIILLGGIGNPWGAALAAAIVVVLPEKLQLIQEYRFLLYAVLVILVLLYRPQGLLPRQLRVYLPGWRPR
jgi:ABC-type branched-subunit amino acid transport system permease subunit